MLPSILSHKLKTRFHKIFQTLLRQQVIQIITLGITAIGVGAIANQMGLLEALELRAYDTVLRSQKQHGTDPRFLIVGVNETDLQTLQVSTPSDAHLAQALAILQRSQPRVIGLDFYRDIPQGNGQAELTKALQAENVIAIYRLTNQQGDRISAPPGVPPERSGFNDITEDVDGVIRRALLFAEEETAFALQIAFISLAKQGILPENAPNAPGILQLKQAIFQPVEPTSGAYRHADARGYQMFLNYRNPVLSHKVSLSDVLNHKVPASWIQNKIILIGNTALSSKDYFYTPYSPAQTESHKMSGVEIHGQIISQLLDVSEGKRQLVQTLPDRFELIWIVFWGLVSGIFAWQARQKPPWIVAQVGLTLAPPAIACWLLTQGIWLPIIAPMVQTMIVGGAVIGYRAQMLQRQNRMALMLLGQNTSPTVAQTLWENRHDLVESGKLTGQQAIATMLFSDLQGFSSISEHLTPKELMQWLNEYLGIMTEEIHRHQGIVNKFMGDGIFAVFGVPIVRSEDQQKEIATDAQNAVNAALAMAQQLEKLNQRWQQQKQGTVNMRIGIATGAVVVGSLGSRERSEYGIIGDTVNTASRLESCQKERQPNFCRILISGATHQYLTDASHLEYWGMLELKGKQQRVDVYHIPLQ
ncbi:MAG: adenylate/guanylate cyclase domain-containing protein [Synechococcales bacterium]|nr:adenylate/guanylate cyclase domain-containing protein [Synechococcales bacterium]